MENLGKVISIQYIPNSQLVPHSESEIEHLVKKGILSEESVMLNQLFIDFINEQKKSQKASSKQSEAEKGLNDLERIQIQNNTFHNKAELILKIPAAGKLSDKQMKALIEHRNGSTS